MRLSVCSEDLQEVRSHRRSARRISGRSDPFHCVLSTALYENEIEGRSRGFHSIVMSNRPVRCDELLCWQSGEKNRVRLRSRSMQQEDA